MAKDQRTRYQGVYVRHQDSCASHAGRRCSCRPGYLARVWDRAAGKQRRSPTFRSIDAAKNWRADTIGKLDRGELPDSRRDLRVAQAIEQFIEAARIGKVLSKRGRRYKKRSLEDLESALTVHAKPVLGARRLSDVRRGDVQVLVDDLTLRLSGSRVRTVVNALRSMYRWAQDRDLVSHDPAQRVRLPAMDAQARDRVATVTELEALLVILTPPDALPYALAGYGTARLQEARHLDWADVDFELGAMFLGADPNAQKTDAAKRPIPLLQPLKRRLREEWLRQGRPDRGKVLPPRAAHNRSGLVSVQGIDVRAVRIWGAAGLNPIGMQECRHTAGSWMNAAGVNPKVASELMGHSTPQRVATARAGAADITLSRYTHMLPGDLEGARQQLEAYLVRESADGTSDSAAQ